MDMLSRQKLLLDKLIDDSCNKLTESERNIDKISIEALIWNLFKGKYYFNLKDIGYIINNKLNNNLKESLEELYLECEHGDEEHRKWLKDKFNNFLERKLNRYA